MNIQKFLSCKRFFFYCNYGLSLLGVGLSICQQYAIIVVLVPRCDELYREWIGSFKLDQVSFRVFLPVGLRQHALIYTYSPFVRLQKYYQEETLGKLLQCVTE